MEMLSRYTHINADRLADKLAHLSALASWLWSSLFIDKLIPNMAKKQRKAADNSQHIVI